MCESRPLVYHTSYSREGPGENFRASFMEADRDFTPQVQVGCDNEAAATHTPVNNDFCNGHPSCKPNKTPAANASPAPAVPAMCLDGSLSEDCQMSSPLRVRANAPSGK